MKRRLPGWIVVAGLMVFGAIAIGIGLSTEDSNLMRTFLGVGIVLFLFGVAGAWVLMHRGNFSRAREERALYKTIIDQQSKSKDDLLRVSDQMEITRNVIGSEFRTLTKAIEQGVRSPHVTLKPGSEVGKISLPLLEHVEERIHRPITGWIAEQWSADRAREKSFKVEEKIPAHRTPKLPFASDIPVAMIADDFTFNSFREEFNTFRLHPSNWRTTFEKAKPQFFFCESAWQGGDPDKSPWRGKIYSSARFMNENRRELIEIIEYCRKQGIPTVFWNKEDPTHYGDRINDFIRTAFLFDYIFTTAEECVPNYKYDLKRDQVDVLPFAVQPRLFNPLGRNDVKDRANFAGTWYRMYEKRTKAAEEIMDLVIETGRDLVIYDRMYDLQSPHYQYPDKYQDFIRPSISFRETANVYKESKFGITLNTVTDSTTMFARRVFELAASGTVVLSNYSRGVENFFGDAVIFADRDPDRLRNLSKDQYQELQAEALAISLRNTYTHRAETILRRLGIEFISRYEMPAAFGEVSTRNETDRLISAAHDRELNGGIIAVADDAEPGLQMSLMRERIDNWTVVSSTELRNADYRTRSLLSARGVIVSDKNLRFPSKEMIAYLALHENYTDLPTKRISDSSERFIETVSALDHAYIPAGAFRDTFTSPNNKIFSV